MLTDEQAAYWTRRLPRTYADKQPCEQHERKKITFNMRLLERAINSMPARYKGDLAIEKAAKQYGYTPEALMQPIRSKTIVRARSLAMYVYSKVTGAGPTATGRRFEKDHSTVLHAIKKIEMCPALKKLGDDIVAHVLWLKS